MAYRNYAPANGFLVDAGGHGDFTTIASALTAATSGKTIFILPGTYTENLTLKAGVSLVSWAGDGFVPNVTIVGKCTFTVAGTANISNIRLETNSDFFVAVTGSAASILNLNNCYLNCTNNTGISFTSSSSSSKIIIRNCEGNLGTTGIGLFASTSAGELSIKYCSMSNTGASSTASSMAGGVLNISYSDFAFVFSASSSTIGTFQNTRIQSLTNSTCLALTGTANFALQGGFYATGTPSAISIGAGTTASISLANIASSNANVLTGAGTMNYGGIVFSGSSSGHNVTTETPYATLN